LGYGKTLNKCSVNDEKIKRLNNRLLYQPLLPRSHANQCRPAHSKTVACPGGTYTVITDAVPGCVNCSSGRYSRSAAQGSCALCLAGSPKSNALFRLKQSACIITVILPSALSRLRSACHRPPLRRDQLRPLRRRHLRCSSGNDGLQSVQRGQVQQSWQHCLHSLPGGNFC
jgi:hypothetical protein